MSKLLDVKIGSGLYQLGVFTLVKKLWSYDFSSIFCEFLNFAKYAPLWFTAELQGEWAELVCDVSRGSHFAWRDDERVKRLQIRGHRGIVQRKKFTTMSYRCVAANCRNVVDLSKCIQHTFLWRLNNHFVKIQQAKWEPI